MHQLGAFWGQTSASLVPGPPLIRPDSNEILPVIPTTDLRAAFDWRPHATDEGMKKRSSCNLIEGEGGNARCNLE